jgi:hypothetical protein
VNEEWIDSMAEALLEPPPDRKPREVKRKSWKPKLGPIGHQILKARSVLNRPDDVLVKLLYGERGSAKTNTALHDLVYHCYADVGKPLSGVPNIPPLAVICTIFRAAATDGGAWEKLHSLVLPEWYDGIGLEFTEPKQDDQKNRFCFIGNRYGPQLGKNGGWSRVILKSIPYGENIRARLKGIEPSYFLSEEITDQGGPDYFFVPFQQLRRPTRAPRIFIASCNPADTGEEHWVWKNFVQIPCRTAGNAGPELPEEGVGGRLKGLDEQFQVFHVPVKDNVHWSPEEVKGYQNTILAEARFDKTAIDRLIKGLWTPRPTGEGLFKEYFRPTIHVKGDSVKGIGLMPKPGYPIYVGYDLGQVWSSITFEQRIPTIKSTLWTVFDEIDKEKTRILYKNLAMEILDHMRWWRKKVGYEFQYIHITDESAINQWRPGGGVEGSYDALVFEREFNKHQQELGGFDPNSGFGIKLLGCPKGAGSISGRVQLLQSKLYQDELFVSATCQKVRDMLMFLEADKKNPENPRETSKYTHKFDSLTYPMWRMEINPDNRIYLPEEAVAPSLISCG